MILKKTAFALLLFGVLSSCIKDEGGRKPAPGFFPMKQMINETIAELSNSGAKFRKSVNWNGQRDTLTISGDSTHWAKELQLFIDADICNQSTASKFSVSKDNVFNSFTITYKRKEPASVGVEQQLVTRSESGTDSILEIATMLNSSKELYDSKKTISLSYLKKPGDVWKLVGYEIGGDQDVFLSDKNLFQVSSARIVKP